MRRFAWALLALLPLAWASSLPALNLHGGVYLAAAELAEAAGLSLEAQEASLSLGGEKGFLTGFSGSPDLLWRPAGGAEEERSLRLPVVKRGGRWYLPEEALRPLGLRLEGGGLRLEDGRLVALAFPSPTTSTSRGWEVLRLAGGVEALSFYALSRTGAETVSLTLIEPRLLALAFPQERASLGRATASLSGSLYLAVVATDHASWESEMTFIQAGRSFTVTPRDLELLAGDLSNVGPEEPVAALVFLPSWIELRRPLTVRWAEVSATFQFSR
jgi:hypothetical protein